MRLGIASLRSQLRPDNDERQPQLVTELAWLIPNELVWRFAFSGCPKDVREQIDASRRLDIDEVILAISSADLFAFRC
ncbi:hypothetical protein [Bradyrhizobium sp. Leo121]|uniref:hypothetical protein n=1 Tax=Bradyrhizobium sp. Leo121 TaxID=1571195 RepID=UPI00102A4B74|nr:hypothetical protein [Bradyrhizobium sp. Leo121]RZN34257.1 hypothetical protein CWO90_07475 [Bradyrhizobium sp. Leo121]